MIVALLPPQPELLSFEEDSSMHLLLNHWVCRNEYREHYCRLSMSGRHYVILDNSAHETGNGTQIESLVKNARRVRASEMVVPDVLDDGMATLQRSCDALDWLLQHPQEWCRTGPYGSPPRLMLVPQGHDLRDWQTCLFGLIQKFFRVYGQNPELFVKSPVIGMSKDYDHWPGGIARLIRDHLMPLWDAHRMDVHCLGWGRNLWELNRLAQEFPWIRSTDSAKPFVYAKKGVMLDPEHEQAPEYPGRPKEYIDWEFTHHQREVAKHNVRVFQRLAVGRADPVSA